MALVLDASAVLAFLRDEEGAARVEEALALDTTYIHAVNLCEVYYDLLRNHDEIVAELAVDILAKNGVITVEDLTLPLLRVAARLKAQGSVALGDVFAIALAMRQGIPVLTCDRGEFSAFAESGSVAVEFLRA